LITVRLATLEDTVAITEIHKSHKTGWTRANSTGELIPADYADLTLYERWQQGGPWVSVETCAVHINRLLSGSGVPLVAESNGEVLAEAEVYEGFEPPPFGHHLNLAVIIVHAKHLGIGFGSALMKYIVEMARLMKCERITVSQDQGREFYVKQGFRRTRSGHGIRIPAQLGRVFYQATNLVDREPEQIKGWSMPFGRYQSARQEWEKLFPQSWAAGVPDLLNAPTTHLKLNVSAQNAILFLREADTADTQPGDVHLSCWSARPSANPLLTAIRDRAYRDGYRAIISYVLDSDLPSLGGDIQQTDYTQDIFEFAL
jgi:GNAT superfamily N-acetyltransferase